MGQVSVSNEVADTIKKLEVLLNQQFSRNFSYSISGNGLVVAARNQRQGLVRPQVG